MVANLYLLSESLQYNGTDTDEEVLKKFSSFADDLMYILQFKDENIIHVDNKLWEVMVGETQNIFPFIDQLEREPRNILRSVLSNTSNSIDLSINEVTERCNTHDENTCSALISLNKLDGVDSTIIYDKQNWFEFRRFILGKYPIDAEFFISECEKYYINFFFHENNRTSIKPILRDFSNKIIFHLSALHDVFPSINEEDFDNHRELLARFSIVAELDAKASLQGDSKFRKLRFDFDKIEPGGAKSKESLVCEPHMKLCYNDSRDGHYYDHRIYFHFGQPQVHNSKILIAHIGCHR